MATPDEGRKRTWRFRLNDTTALEVSTPPRATEKQVRRRGRWSLIAGTLMAAVALAATALAGTGVDTGDVGIVGDAGASPSGATLVRGGNTTFNLTITANDGNFPSAQCAQAKAEAQPTYTVTGAGLVGSGSYDSRSFVCPWNKTSDGAQSITFENRSLVASDASGDKAPLGRSDYAITFADGLASTTMVRLGNQVNLSTSPAFVNPRVYVTVNPRPPTSLAANAVSSSQIDLGWTASPDASDITDYKVERTGGTQGPTTLTAAKNATSLNDTGLDANTEYCYKMRARYNDGTDDFFSTYEPMSGTVCATTQSAATFTIDGFYQPVENHVTNGAKAGSTIPLKFNILLGGVIQTDTALVTSLIQKYTCTSGANVDNMLTTDELSSGNTSLRFDSVAQQMVFNWKTSKTAGCYRVTLNVQGGASLSIDFNLK